MLPPKYDESAAVCKDVGSSFSCPGCCSMDEAHTFKDGECRYKKYGDKYYEQQRSDLWCMVGSEYALLKYCTIVKLKNRPDTQNFFIYPIVDGTNYTKSFSYKNL